MSSVTSADPAPPLMPPALPERDRYEVVDGKRVELPPMSIYASFIATRLVGELSIWLKTAAWGVVVSEGLFQFPAPVNRNRRPDVALVSFDRWPKGQNPPESDNAWPVVPDVAAEVVSPTDYAEDLLERIEEYFRAGVRTVWVVYPRRRLLQVYESLSQIRGLGRQDTLDGGAVLPGFHLPLEALFG